MYHMGIAFANTKKIGKKIFSIFLAVVYENDDTFGNNSIVMLIIL